MKGKTDEEILREREQAVREAESLELLSTADLVYFAKGWEEARGCRIEHMCAVQYELQIIG